MTNYIFIINQQLITVLNHYEDKINQWVNLLELSRKVNKYTAEKQRSKRRKGSRKNRVFKKKPILVEKR